MDLLPSITGSLNHLTHLDKLIQIQGTFTFEFKGETKSVVTFDYPRLIEFCVRSTYQSLDVMGVHLPQLNVITLDASLTQDEKVSEMRFAAFKALLSFAPSGLLIETALEYFGLSTDVFWKRTASKESYWKVLDSRYQYGRPNYTSMLIMTLALPSINPQLVIHKNQVTLGAIDDITIDIEDDAPTGIKLVRNEAFIDSSPLRLNIRRNDQPLELIESLSIVDAIERIVSFEMNTPDNSLEMAILWSFLLQAKVSYGSIAHLMYAYDVGHEHLKRLDLKAERYFRPLQVSKDKTVARLPELLVLPWIIWAGVGEKRPYTSYL